MDTEPQAPPPTNQSTDRLIGQTALQAQTPIGAQTPSEAMSTRASVALSEEDWATPAMQQEKTQQLNPPIDPQILTTQVPFSFTQTLEDSQPNSSLYPLNGIDGAFATQDADTWLDNMINNNDNEWMRNTTEVAPSPPTSMATDSRIARGDIWRGCTCQSHQAIYNDWPSKNAELTIAQCMRTCMYCGSDFQGAAELRKHIKRIKYARRNLTVCQETRGKYSSTTPSWTPIPIQRSDSEPLIRPSNARTTRSQSVTNSAIAAESPW